jgi:hypothetical protein
LGQTSLEHRPEGRVRREKVTDPHASWQFYKAVLDARKTSPFVP